MKNPTKHSNAFANSLQLFFYHFILFFLFTFFSNGESFAQLQTIQYSNAGTYTWTAPCGVTSLNVEIWGAGGGGGFAVTGFGIGPCAGGGGGGGAYRTQSGIAVTPGTTYTIVVGAGGSSGSNGGNSSAFGFSANAGMGGGNGFFGLGAGGAGATAATYNGGNGFAGTALIGGGGGSSAGNAANGLNATGSLGALAPVGGGNGGNGANGNGMNASSPGGGGGGGRVPVGGFASAAGGNGGNGQVIISYNGLPTLCTPSFSTVRAITNVTFAGINHSNTGTEPWQQFCNMGTVNMGSTYTINISGNGNGGPGNVDYYNVFIDWNQNGDLTDDGIYNIGSLSGTGSVNGSISVPLTALSGTTRMRVIKRRGGYATGPCQSSGTGQAEDYLLMVEQPPACTTPGNPTALNLNFITTPSFAINGSFTGSGASGYLVIQTTGATAPITPVNGVTYPIGSNALGGTIIANGTATSFSATNIFQATEYCFWVYAYNANCTGTPFYSTGTANACITTSTCNEIATMTLTANETKNWNNPASWSPAIVPSTCTNVTINYSADGGNDIDLASSIINANFNIKSLTINGNFSNAGAYTALRRKQMRLLNNGYVLNVQEDVNMSADNGTDFLATGNTLNAHSINFNSIGNSILNVYGNTTIGGLNDEQLSVFGSDAGAPTFYFWGNVTFNKYANAAPNGTYVFEKNGAITQSLVNNISNNNTSLRLLFQNMKVGEAGTSFPILNLSGDAGALKTGIAGGNLSIKSGAILNLPNGTGLSQHTATANGNFTMDATAQLNVAGTTSNVTHSGVTYAGYAGNNFPANFANYNFIQSSTVNYNSNGGVHQTIFPFVTYGNLVLSVGNSMPVLSNKTFNASVAGIAGNLSVEPYASMNLQTNTANRTNPGGVFTLASNANLSVGGNAGGAGFNNNFPANFNSKVFAANSNTYYNYGGEQGIYADVDYGNLYLSITGNKTAPAILNLNGNLAINGSANFIHNNGTVYFNAAANAQSYSATTPATFYNITNNNTHASGLTVLSNLSVVNEINLSANARLFLTGDIILLSTAAATASVGQLPATAIINYSNGGRFEVQRFIQHYQKWNLLAVPLSNTGSLRTTWQENGLVGPSVAGMGTQITGPGGANGLDAHSPGNSVKWWNPVTQAFTMVTNTLTEAANRSDGFFTYARGDRNYGPGAAGSITTLRAKGEIFSGANPPVAFTRSGLAATASVSFANPYASAIDFAKLYADATNIKAGFHVWDPTLTGNYSVGGYQYITTDGIITPGTGLYSQANVGTNYTHIQSGQAVYVEPLLAGTLSLSFSESHKTSGSRLLSRTEGETPSMLSTMLHNSDGTLLDGNRVLYHAQYTNQLGAEDGSKILNSGENFGILSNTRRLIVEGRKPPVANDTIYYNMSNLRNQPYRLSFAPMHLSNTGLLAELIDNYLQIRTPVSLTDSSFYNFTVNNDAASKAASRFMLVFKTATVLPVNFVKISARANADKSNTINWSVANEINMVQYEVERSSNGSNFVSIGSTSANGAANYQQTDLLPMDKENFYRIKALGLGAEVVYSPIVKIASAKLQASISIINPVVARQLNIRFTNQALGNYAVVIMANNGQMIQTERIAITAPYTTQAISILPTVATGNYKVLINSDKAEVVFSENILIP